MADDLPTELLDFAERRMLREAAACLRGHPESLAWMEGLLGCLDQLGHVLERFPSLLDSSTLAGRSRDPDSLVERLIRLGSFASPLELPVKASLARDFVLAKIQAFRAILLAVQAPGVQAPGALSEELRREIGQSIFTLLAQDLLRDLALDSEVSLVTKRVAAEQLVRFWDRSVELEIDDFCPLLESAWQARNRLVVDFGTLIGSAELLRLLDAAGEPELMDAFLQDGTSVQRWQAFDEFLFGLSFEQLEWLRREMKGQGRAAVDRDWVASTLGIPPEKFFSGVVDPEAMLSSYRSRQLGASHRRLRGSSGPHRTAESFLMLYVLEKP